MKVLSKIHWFPLFSLIILFVMEHHIEAGSPVPRNKARPGQSSKKREPEHVNREHLRPESDSSGPSDNEINYIDRSRGRNKQDSPRSYHCPVDEPDSQDEENRERQRTENDIEKIGQSIGWCISHVTKHPYETHTFNLIAELIKMGFGKILFDPIRFPSYPYFLDEPGFVRRRTNDYRKGFGWFSIHYLRTMTDNNSIGLSFRGRTYSRCAISLDYHQYDELRSHYKKSLLNTFRFGVQKKILINEIFIFDLDFGFRSVNQYLGGDIGFHVQAFPEKPFILSGWSRVGIVDGQELFEFDTSFGIIIKRTEIYCGFRILDFKNHQYPGVQIGWRLWF